MFFLISYFFTLTTYTFFFGLQSYLDLTYLLESPPSTSTNTVVRGRRGIRVARWSLRSIHIWRGHRVAVMAGGCMTWICSLRHSYIIHPWVEMRVYTVLLLVNRVWLVIIWPCSSIVLQMLLPGLYHRSIHDDWVALCPRVRARCSDARRRLSRRVPGGNIGRRDPN